MAMSKQAVTSLITEHFGYTPLTLLDDIINTVNELVYRAVNAVEEGLSNAPAKSLGFDEQFAAEHPNVAPETDDDGIEIYPNAKVEIENGVHQLETLLQASMDKKFDLLEIYVLRNILTVRPEEAPWVRLAHYENLPLPPTTPSESQKAEQEQQPTTESLSLLRRKVTETRRLHNILLAERARNEAIINQLKTLLETATAPSADTTSQPSLSFLTSSAAAKSLNLSLTPSSTSNRHSTASTSSVPPTPRTKASSTQPLTTHTRFLVSQLPALRQAVATLRSKAAEDGASIRYARAYGAADERREYIEGQVKRKLEQEGVDVAGSTGEGTAMGKKVGAEEVKGIEKIAGMVGSEQFRSTDQAPADRDEPMEE